jgi:hypothetical protein
MVSPHATKQEELTMTNRVTTIALGSLLALGIASSAMAQPVPDHPRVNEVDRRLETQQGRINNGVARGQIAPGQAARDERLDARVGRQESRDEAMHGGHLTKREDRHLNRELNHNSRRIHAQRH